MNVIYFLTRVAIGMSMLGTLLSLTLSFIPRRSDPLADTPEGMAQRIGFRVGLVVSMITLAWIWKALGTASDSFESEVKSRAHLRFRGCVLLLLALVPCMGLLGSVTIAVILLQKNRGIGELGFAIPCLLVVAAGLGGKGIEMLLHPWEGAGHPGATPPGAPPPPDAHSPAPRPAAASAAFYSPGRNRVRLKF